MNQIPINENPTSKPLGSSPKIPTSTSAVTTVADSPVEPQSPKQKITNTDIKTNKVEKNRFESPLDPKNQYLKEKCKTSASHFRRLVSKHKLMEVSIRRLLRSLKELKDRGQSTEFNQELDKIRIIKLIQIIKMLILQKRNMQLQNDSFRKEIFRLNKKFSTLRKRGETLLVENINMRKYYGDPKGDCQRISLEIDKLLPKEEILRKEIHSDVNFKVEVENIKLELGKITVENRNLRESLQISQLLLKCKTRDKKMTELKDSPSTTDIKRDEGDDRSSKCRIERLTTENDGLKRELLKFKSSKENLTMISFDYERLKEKYSEFQKNYHKLEKLYLQESENRRFLHNQLQEEKGNFRVLCRVKPDAKEPFLGFKGTDKIKLPDSCHLTRGDGGFYIFNRVFRPKATNKDLFDETKSLLSSCIDGYNVCFLAYGPTGSGKTYTMQGTRDDPGLTLRTIAELSDLIQSVKTIWEVRTSISMIEIHNEVIYDLLSKCVTSVRLSDDGYDVRLIDIDEKLAVSEQDILFWIAKGHKRRKMAATKLNLQSSRSHLIIRICLFMQNRIDSSKRTSTLIFCDLAGSESADKIDANDTLKIETGHINRSLVTLGRVFDCLRQQKTPVPYRDSKLTHLLKPCLGGQAKCLLIVTISGEMCKVNRSIKALQFGRTAMDIAVGKIKQNISILSGKTLSARFR